FNDDINSIVVGPGAQVTLFQDQDFTDNNLIVGPGQRIPRLRDFDLANEIQSMRIVAVKPPEPPVALIVKEKDPTVVIADASAHTGGVWVELFASPSYAESGSKVTLKGPAEFPDLRNVFGASWRDKASSIVAGPDATVVLFSGENFTGKRIALSPGQRVPDLTSFDLGNDVESIQVMKAPPPTR
ncbi:MAG TPA: hypothetical protein VKE69_07250, partial [Planctomycetota bacterium]|nr:hypothetical protein [Planctomycetota bacterium]